VEIKMKTVRAAAACLLLLAGVFGLAQENSAVIDEKPVIYD
jgi:hypothetical protein